LERRPVAAAVWFLPARVLYAAVQLGIVDQLAEGPRSTPELAAAVRAEQASLEHLLRALECFDGVAMQAHGVVELTGPGARLRTEAPIAVNRLVRLFGCTEMWRTWGELPQALSKPATSLGSVPSPTSVAELARYWLPC
jgi:hypothetical protein